jgi:hypothetical protein
MQMGYRPPLSLAISFAERYISSIGVPHKLINQISPQALGNLQENVLLQTKGGLVL